MRRSQADADRELPSYWACRNWYKEYRADHSGEEEPTIGEAFDAGCERAALWYRKRNDELEKMHADLREHTTAIYELTGGWYGG